MKNPLWLLGNRPFLWALLSSTLFALLISFGVKHDLSKADWGVWVGAIGTVCTLAGTIWLATAAERRRKQEQHDRAIIAAAELSLWLHNLRRALHAAEAMLPGHLDALDDPRLAFMQATSVIDDVGIWTREDLLPLICLPNHVAARLAWTTSNIRSVLTSLRRSSGLENIEPKILVLHTNLSRQLKGCMKELDNAYDELVGFLGSRGFDVA